MENEKGYVTPMLIISISLWLFNIISYIVNVVKLIDCDFESPYKEEFIHAIGLIPGLSMFTCWF